MTHEQRRQRDQEVLWLCLTDAQRSLYTTSATFKADVDAVLHTLPLLLAVAEKSARDTEERLANVKREIIKSTLPARLPLGNHYL